MLKVFFLENITHNSKAVITEWYLNTKINQKIVNNGIWQQKIDLEKKLLQENLPQNPQEEAQKARTQKQR